MAASVSNQPQSAFAVFEEAFARAAFDGVPAVRARDSST